MAESHLSRALMRRPRFLAALAFAVVSSACAGTRAPVETQPSPQERARADSARYPYTEADIRFMSGMISHHAQAIVMAKWAPTHGGSAAIIRLTERIINAQTDEIKAMQTWLADRNQPVPAADPKGMMMNMGGMQHKMLMPGMLSEAQMSELEGARGSEFDRLFLTYMIQHHRGAVAMVTELFANRGAGQDEIVFKFASDVAVDQTTEINRMLEMLLTLPSSDS
jgi:uncharacterized protein (DUF305 family)